jgi:hypothetical protein
VWTGEAQISLLALLGLPWILRGIRILLFMHIDILHIPFCLIGLVCHPLTIINSCSPWLLTILYAFSGLLSHKEVVPFILSIVHDTGSMSLIRNAWDQKCLRFFYLFGGGIFFNICIYIMRCLGDGAYI